MSSSLSDVEDQSSASPNSFFQYIPLKNDLDQSLHNSNPESSFYVIKNSQQSSPFHSSSTTNLTRSGNARTLFTIIPPLPQDMTIKNNVMYKLIVLFHFVYLIL